MFYPPYKLGYGAEEYLDRLEVTKKDPPIEVLPQQINPYALGHIINHPPPGTPQTACLIDFEVPDSFFPSFLLNHFPYMKNVILSSSKPKTTQVVGIISLQYLQNQEIFLNYGTERFPENFTPS